MKKGLLLLPIFMLSTTPLLFGDDGVELDSGATTMRLRPSAQNEMRGLDNVYHGERGYGMLNPN